MQKLEHLQQCSDKKDAENVILKEKLQASENMKRKYEQAMLKCFTEDQAQCLVSGKSISHWQENDIINALTPKSLSLKTYK